MKSNDSTFIQGVPNFVDEYTLPIFSAKAWLTSPCPNACAILTNAGKTSTFKASLKDWWAKVMFSHGSKHPIAVEYCGQVSLRGMQPKRINGNISTQRLQTARTFCTKAPIIILAHEVGPHVPPTTHTEASLYAPKRVI